MTNHARTTALRRIIHHYEKCHDEIAALHRDLSLSSSEPPFEDILRLNTLTLEALDRSLQLAYARLEREHTRAVAETRSAAESRAASEQALPTFRVALQ
jgi:hypothetical protein